MSDVAVVFGASGFVGSHLADELCKRGYHVRVCDLRPSPYLNGEQDMVILDLADRDAVHAACIGARFVFNYAGVADIDEAQSQARATVLSNVLGNIHVLEACRELSVERYIYASTIYVYSDTGSFYRISKQAAEAYTEEFGRRYGLRYTILRFGSLYGRRAGPQNTIAKLLRQAIERKTMTYDGTGDELREYIHVVDAARAAADACESDDFANRRLILTGHAATRVKDVLHMIQEMLPFPVQVEFRGESQAAHYNITPYKYTPKVGEKLVLNRFIDMGQGILDCIEEISS